MYCTYNLTEDLIWIGASDRRLALFENVFPIPRGISYNAYLLKDDVTVLFDTVDRSVAEQFFENLEYALQGRKLDYLIVSHMEPDHCSTIGELLLRYPNVKIIGNVKTLVLLKQFFGDVNKNFQQVKEGDCLSTGMHNLTFVMAPMVHWPEVMLTYDTVDGILMSADAFGTFGALNGNIFADELNFKSEWLPDARRYYSNIVGKYGNQVQAVLKKAAGLTINMLCPLHGPVWRKNISWFVDKYFLWSSYTPEEQGVLIAYASVYGGTENAAQIFATELAKRGVKNVAMYDVSATHPSYIVAEAFRYSHLALFSTTYNAGVFCNMETLITDLAAHNLQNRTVTVVENGSWAPTAKELITAKLEKMKVSIIDNPIKIMSRLTEAQLPMLGALADAVIATFEVAKAQSADKIEPSAMFKFSYGLFVLTACDGGKDNGCIINTAIQLTDNPKRIVFAVNKANYTHDMISKTKKFCLSVLTTQTPFNVFTHFGFQSGKNVNKFEDCKEENRADNGVLYIPKFTNAYFAGNVVSAKEYGTHTLFVAEVTEAKTLSGEPSVTYQYYFDNIKPKPEKFVEKKGFVCDICGYVYEGDVLPDDFICPLCKHDVSAFSKL